MASFLKSSGFFFLLVIGSVLFYFNIQAQTPSANFTIPGTICKGENLLISNTSSNAIGYEWSFCADDLSKIPTSEEVTTLSATSTPFNMTVAEDGGKWYGFVTDQNNNALLRLNYENSLNNPPTVTNLNNVGSLLSGPRGVKLIKEGDNWYGLIVNSTNSRLIRINFGSSLSNPSPTASYLSGITGLSTPIDLDLVEDTGTYYAAVSNFGNNKVTVVSFGTSMANLPLASDILSNVELVSGTGLQGISLKKDNGNWFVFAVHNSLGKIYKMSYGTSFTGSPTIAQLPGLTMTTPAILQMVREQGKYYGLISTSGGALWRIGLGCDLSRNTVTSTNLGTFSMLANTRALSLTNENGSWYGFTINSTTKKLYRIKFPNDNSGCPIVSSCNTSAVPSEISYSSAGTYDITLTAYHSNGSSNSITKSLTVSSTDAPLIDFSKNSNECINSSIEFTGTVTNGQTISSWNWDFGDGSIATGQNVSHQFSLPGSYVVKLQVQSSNGCSNFIRKIITILNSTVSDFIIPSGIFCTNSVIDFLNSSTGESGSSVKWNWDIIDAGNTIIHSSTSKNLNYSFLTSGNYQVKLTSGATGCSSSISKSISVLEGPNVSFNYTKNCFGEAVQFLNKSVGTNINSYLWEIRNSGNSLIASYSTENASHQFTQVGNYSMTLRLGTQSGCSNSFTRSLTVNNSPKAEINVGLIIENLPVEFAGSDQTGVDEDIVSWKWDFAGLGTSSNQVSNFTFNTPGSYLIKLEVETTQGCKEIISKTITVEASTTASANFTIPSTICKGENLAISNTSVNATGYEWSFCADDLSKPPTSEEVTTLSTTSTPFNMTVAEDGGKWYGFVTDQNSNALLRLNYDNSLNNPPIVTNLNNVGSLLSGPRGVKLIKEGANWYGLIVNSTNSRLIRINFGSSLSNPSPTATYLSDVAALSTPIDLDLVEDNGTYYAAISNFGNNKITIVSFGTSMANIPLASDILSNVELVSGTGLQGISLKKDNGNWFVFAVHNSLGKIYKVSYGTSFTGSPTIAQLPGLTMTTPAILQMVREQGKYYGLISTSGGALWRIALGCDLSRNTVTNTNLGTFGMLANTRALSLTNENGSWYGFTINSTTKKLYRIKFSNDNSGCPIVSSCNTTADPSGVSYTSAGTYDITLTAYHSNGSSNSITKSLTVSSTDAPLIDFSKNSNECINSSIEFTGTVTNGQTISNWSWDFGDGTAATGQNVSHQFSLAGTYKVSLVVTSENSCRNTYIRNDTVYDETTPNFSESSGILCSSGPITFTNTSTKETGPKVKWLWDFGDGQTSSEKEPTHTYANGGTYTVTLTAGVEGCSNTFSKDIEVIQGPKTGFSFQNHCLGETTSFTNETIGDNITGYDWDFGDGNTSTIPSPQHTYTAIGNYNVILKVSNINGCEVTKTIEVQIHDLPVVDFTPSALLCSTDSLQFIDNSTLSDGNIAQWIWTINNEQLAINNQFIGKDAKLYFPEPGDYKVTLTATSEAGCSTSATKDLTILKSPEISIDATNLCAGDSAIMEGVSELENQNIVAWTWQMSDGGMNEGQNIRHKFASPGTYIIYLTAISENSCPKTIVKEVTVYSKPVAKFGSVNNCLNAPVQFSDSSTVDGDVITSWNWKVFNEQLTMINEQSVQHPQFTFHATGNYQVELTVTTSLGCSSTIRKTVTIHPLPVSNFTFEPEVGPPPFQVQFQNSSTGATTYFWDFGNGDTSTEIAPQYTYNVLGTYDVRLISMNAFGCSDTIVKKLLVAPPVTSVAMEKILVSTLTEELAFATELTNTGSKIVRSIEFIIDFGGNLSFKETWTGVLNPEEKMTYSIKTQLLKEQLAKVKYICITAVELNNEAFDFETNNVCINLADQFFVFNPQPNPADDVVSFSYILPEDKPLEINFYTTNGQKITMNMPQYRQGYNQSSFSISSFAQGMYYVEFVYGGQRTKKKLVVY